MARDASPADLRRAYRRRLVAAHPDKGGDPDSFRALQAAYAVLSDTSERLIYDEQLDRRLGGLDGSSVAGSGSKGAAGVTAVVHGQTEGHRLSRLQPPCTAHEAGRGNQGAHCGAEVQAATAAIQALQGGSGSCADLAAAHLQRARLHRAAGQLHHALFDAEEALRLQPEEEQAAALAAELAAAAAGGGQPRAGAAEPDGPSCSSDDDPF